jgi:hypothetical protein
MQLQASKHLELHRPRAAVLSFKEKFWVRIKAGEAEKGFIEAASPLLNRQKPAIWLFRDGPLFFKGHFRFPA